MIHWDGSKPINLTSLGTALFDGFRVISEGTPPRTREWRHLQATYPDQIITHEPESANRDPQAIHDAIALGDRRLDPAQVKVFNALPYEDVLQNYMHEQTRMGVGGTLEYWKDLQQDVNAYARAYSEWIVRGRATKEALLTELRSGTSDVLIVYAHFDGERLYMPGAYSETISVEELASIDRTNDLSVRNRVVVLVACKTAAWTPENPRSLTSVLLEKGIARTVMATDRPFDSYEIPALLNRLARGLPLRKAVAPDRQNVPFPLIANPVPITSFLQQYVELSPPAIASPAWPWCLGQVGFLADPMS